MKKQQSGFTLIELVVVIVILGILAAVAMPRFSDMGKDARKASVKGMYGALQSATAIAHASALSAGGAGTASITMENETVTMSAYYPTVDADGIGKAVKHDGYGTAVDTGKYRFAVNGASTEATCAAFYGPAGTNGVPNITYQDGGC